MEELMRELIDTLKQQNELLKKQNSILDDGLANIDRDMPGYTDEKDLMEGVGKYVMEIERDLDRGLQLFYDYAHKDDPNY